jgi:hypothetical protein
MSISRKQLRRDIVRNLGDLRILTATAPGTNVTLIDTISLVGEVDAYKGREVLFTGGTAANLGLTRYVQSSSSSLRAIAFGITLPAATTTGDECEMVNTRGVGYRFQDIHDAINESIRTVSDRALVTAATQAGVYARANAIPIPVGFKTIENVQWQDQSYGLAWHNIPKAKTLNGNGWWVDRANRTLQLTGNPAWNADAMNIQVWGLAEPPEMFNDADLTEVDQEWLKFNTLATLMRAKSIKMPTPETDRLMYMLSSKADQLRAKILIRRSPFSESL